MPADRDEDSGKLTEQCPQEAFLHAVESIEHTTTAKVAAEVGCSYDLAYRRLDELGDGGDVERVEIGSTLVWPR